MATFGIGECRNVGLIKERIKNAILDGEIPNEHDAARELMIAFAATIGLTPVDVDTNATSAPASDAPAEQ